MKEFKEFWVPFLLIHIFIYLFCSFIAWHFSPGHWSTFLRVFAATASLVLIICCIADDNGNKPIVEKGQQAIKSISDLFQEKLGR